jgi:hypothetical protein
MQIHKKVQLIQTSQEIRFLVSYRYFGCDMLIEQVPTI